MLSENHLISDVVAPLQTANGVMTFFASNIGDWHNDFQNKTFSKRFRTMSFQWKRYLYRKCTSSSKLSATTTEKSPPILSPAIIHAVWRKKMKSMACVSVDFFLFCTTFIDTLLHSASFAPNKSQAPKRLTLFAYQD